LLLVPDPTSPELSLALRWRSWSELVCPGEAHPYLVGEYLEQMPQLLGNAPGVDASIKCAFTSSLAVLNRHRPDNYVDACALAVRAVSTMRATASTALQNSMLATYTLLALALLNLAEVGAPSVGRLMLTDYKGIAQRGPANASVQPSRRHTNLSQCHSRRPVCRSFLEADVLGHGAERGMSCLLID
jgi:hypothetical protein